MSYQPVIGLEIHAELHTNTKMFCGCKNDPLERRPNINICPICMAHPGTLPTLNKTAISHVLKVGLALNADIADFTEWDRKNYFYPDIPKGYQISQYAYPLVQKGKLTVKNNEGKDVTIGITRIHLEEDTARSSHDKGEYSVVDYNRAGLPLMELVTEPEIRDAKSAGNLGRELQLLLQTLGVSEANMELGQMRVEVNISIHKEGEPWGTKVEIKNLNSFRSAERSIEYEILRQAALLDAGEKVIQETRGFDEGSGKTFSQRTKENANDYRYFPDPDLPKLYLSKMAEFDKDFLRSSLPEFPWTKRTRYMDIGMKAEDAEVCVADNFFGSYVDRILNREQLSSKAKTLAINYIMSDIAGLIKKEADRKDALDVYITENQLAEIVQMIEADKLSSRGAKDLIAFLWKNETAGSTSVEDIANEKGLIQKNDPEAIRAIIQKVIDSNPEQVTGFKAGKEPLLQYLVGQVMKEGKGAVNPGVAQQMLRDMIQ